MRPPGVLGNRGKGHLFQGNSGTNAISSICRKKVLFTYFIVSRETHF